MSEIEQLESFVNTNMPALMDYIMKHEEWTPEQRAQIVTAANTALVQCRILLNRLRVP